jgi:NLR family CARD domain-containing protein 3
MPVDKLNLRNNNLNGENITKHLDNVLNVIDLDLSENKIGKQLIGLKQPIVARNSVLRRLALEKVQLSDHMARSILSWAEVSESLRSLNLADNKLSDEIGDNLISLITKNQNIEELYLSWNNLSSIMAEPFFRAATQSNLKVLDLGWNQIGTNMKVAKKNADASLAAICDFIVNNKSLIHFSLNNNGFSMEESVKVSEALKKNKCIYGFHFSGNNGYVDYLGYLQLDVNPLDIQDSISNHTLNGVQCQSFTYALEPFENTISLKNCCWICEGWIELEIIYPDSSYILN